MGQIQPGSWEHLIIDCLQRVEATQDDIQDKMDRFGDLKPEDEYLRERLARLDGYLQTGLEKLDLRKLRLPEDYQTKLDLWLGHQPTEFLAKLVR